MESRILTGNKDPDLIILSKLDDENLLNFCFKNIYHDS
jgi:hypothetical protein